MKKILITGGAGYIGSVLTPYLHNLGYHITVIDNFLYKQTSLAAMARKDNFKLDRKSTRLNSSHEWISRMPSSA